MQVPGLETCLAVVKLLAYIVRMALSDGMSCLAMKALAKRHQRATDVTADYTSISAVLAEL